MIDLYDGSASLDLALSVAEDFRLSKDQAKAIIKEVSQSVSQWQKIAKGFGLEKGEINRMNSAFDHEEAKKAEKL